LKIVKQRHTESKHDFKKECLKLKI